MIRIKELEEYFGKSFDKILEDNDIVCIAENDLIKLGQNGYIKTTIDYAWEDYCKWEKDNSIDEKATEKYLKSIKNKFYKWVEKCNADELLNYDIETYKRHFKVLDNGKVYYLNNYV